MVCFTFTALLVDLAYLAEHFKTTKTSKLFQACFKAVRTFKILDKDFHLLLAISAMMYVT